MTDDVVVFALLNFNFIILNSHLRIIWSKKVALTFCYESETAGTIISKARMLTICSAWDNNLDEENMVARCDLVIAVFFDCTVGIVRVAWEDAKGEKGGAN